MGPATAPNVMLADAAAATKFVYPPPYVAECHRVLQTTQRGKEKESKREQGGEKGICICRVNYKGFLPSTVLKEGDDGLYLQKE